MGISGFGGNILDSGMQKRIIASLQVALADKQESLENRIRSMCTTNLPFALVPDLCKELLNQLREEEKLMQKLTVEKQLKKINRQISKDGLPG